MGRVGRRPGYTVVVHRDGSVASREYRVPRWLARTATVAAVAILVAVVVFLVIYGPIVAAAGREPLLAREVERLTAENRRVIELARALDDAEARYAQLRGMLGAQIGPPPSDVGGAGQSASGERLYVAPPLLARAPGGAADTSEARDEGPTVPHLWPLLVPSYRTRGMVQSGSPQETHPGIDLAVPVGSDVLATGGGVVREVGQDSAYGLYVLIQHPRGYQSMYGHLSRILVARSDVVRAGQVIALSGNTGRSTAPHLHFEIRLGGQSLDPLTLVREGR
jgi:murein DD-endopeptidase MepM/ murein hydrolase activator NlpD